MRDRPNIGDTSAKTLATGGVSGANAQAVNTQLERCAKTLGTMTIVEGANQPWLCQFTQEYHMQSTVPLLRLIIQQSNCFVIVERALMEGGGNIVPRQQHADQLATAESSAKNWSTVCRWDSFAALRNCKVQSVEGGGLGTRSGPMAWFEPRSPARTG